MVDVKSLLTLALLIVAGQSVPLQDIETVVINKTVQESNENPYRLPKNVVPIHYDIKLIPHIVPGNFTSNGETSIDIEVRKSTNAIALHTVQLTIDEPSTRLTRKGGGDVNSVSNYVPKQHEYNKDTQILTVRFEEPLDLGTYTLYFKYVGEIRDKHTTNFLDEYLDDGYYKRFYIDNEGNQVWLAATHFQPVSAREAFPCWDEPAIKATFKFSIKHYPNFTALSNMPSTRSEVDAADGKLWTYFETTPIMSTNILGFVIADYDHVANSDGTIKIWGPKHLLHHAAYSLDVAERAMQELEKFTNNTVRVPKMDHVTIPHYTSRATENWGMIVYKEDVLLSDLEKLRSIEKIHNIMTIPYELVHQWFGNLVSPAWWNYVWLSEGMSTYLQVYITDKLFKEWRLMDFFIVDVVQPRLLTDSVEWAEPININVTSHLDIREAYSEDKLAKSAILLRMVSHFLSEDVFRNGLIKYIEAHEYSSVTPDDLWKALQDALDESDVPHDNFRVKEVMDTWFEQAGYPLVTVSRNYTTGEIKATQKIFNYTIILKNPAKHGAWWIPINFATQTNLDFSSTLATHWLKPEDESVTIEGVDINDWIIVNKQQTGFYRVNYDIVNWKRIAGFLNSDDYDKISVLNRAQIVDDAFYLMKTQHLDPLIFLEIINYMSREIDLVPWYQGLKIVPLLNDYLRVPETAAIFRPYFYNLIHKVIKHIDIDEHPNDDPWTAIVKSELYETACTYGHSICRSKATAKLLAYVEDPIANKISPNQEWIFCFGLIKANESVWDQFLKAQNETSSIRSLYLGCSENFDIIEKHVNSLAETERFYYNTLFSNIINNLSDLDMAIEFFIKSYDKFTVSNAYIKSIFHDIILNCVREDQFQKLKAFAEKHDIYKNNLVIYRKKKLAKIKYNFSKIRDALKNNQFSVTMHVTLNNNAQTDISHI